MPAIAKEDDGAHYLQDGDTYEGYRVVRHIGSGGYGQVYLARDPTGRVWALKVFLPAEAKDPKSAARKKTAARRFLLEAAILESIKNTHIVRCERHGQAPDGSLWLLLEYLPGNTLRREAEVSELGYMSAERVLRLGIQLATALYVIHGHGIVHRDIKPDNIILLPGDILKVLDFGVAKAQGSSASFRTTRGVHYGTSLYMAPDRLMSASGEASPLWDIYSAGLTLWEARAGRHPFFWDAATELTDAQVIHKHMDGHGIPLLSDIMGDDPDVSDTIHRACAADPRQRYQSAEEMLDAFEAALTRHRAAGTDRISVLGAGVTERTRARITEAITEPSVSFTGAASGERRRTAVREPDPPSDPIATPAGPITIPEPAMSTGPAITPASPLPPPTSAPRWSKTEPIELPPDLAAKARPSQAPASPPRLSSTGTERIDLRERPSTAPAPSPNEPPHPRAPHRPPPPRRLPKAVLAPDPTPRILHELGRPDLTPAERATVEGLDPIDQRYRILFLRYLDTLPPNAAIDMDRIGAAIADYVHPLPAPAPAPEKAPISPRHRAPSWPFTALIFLLGAAFALAAAALLMHIRHPNPAAPGTTPAPPSTTPAPSSTTPAPPGTTPAAPTSTPANLPSPPPPTAKPPKRSPPAPTKKSLKIYDEP